ncbi:MAG: DUF4129 domain-containing protein [Phycisphaerae bacterium]
MRAVSRWASEAVTQAEDAVALLRSTGVAPLAKYYIGTLPMVLGAMTFWTFFAYASISGGDRAAGSLLLALAMVWMKLWQGAFMRDLRLALGDAQPAETPPGRSLRWLGQTALGHLLATCLLLVGAVFVLPLIVIYPFCQYLTGRLDGRRSLRSALRDAARLAWARKGSVAVLTGMILPLLWGVVMLNLQMMGAVLPWLLRLMLGVDTVLSRTPWESSATWLGFSAAIAFLLVDPLSKAVFALRGFDSDAQSSGADLLAALRRVANRRTVSAAAVLLGVLLAIGSPSPCPAQAQPTDAETRRLEKALDEVLQQRKYGWRVPPQEDGERTFMDDVDDWLNQKKRDFQKWWDEFWERDDNDDLVDPQPASDNQARTAKETGDTVTGLLTILTYVLATLAVAGAIVFAVKSMRRQEAAEPEAPSADEPVNVSDESVQADALPEDEWLEMAERLRGEGELRLALRAVFLAELAHLAKQELIVLARHKSNREYHRELLRRGRPLTNVHDALDWSIATFERSWYGHHEVTLGTLDQMHLRCGEVRRA